MCFTDGRMKYFCKLESQIKPGFPVKKNICASAVTALLLIPLFAHGYAFKRYDVRSGLSENSVRCIVQDSMGYMWFATKDGLNRFNGHEFTVYGTSSDGDGRHYNINFICPHRDNRHIWVATTVDLFLFDSRGEAFSVFENLTADGTSVSGVFSMQYDPDGVLWLATPKGVFAYDEDAGRVVNYRNHPMDPHSIPNNHVWVAYCDAAGQMWFGTRSGLARYNPDKDNFTVYAADEPAFGRPPCNEIMALAESADGVMWAGTWYGGLARLDRTRGTFSYYFGEGAPTSISRVRALYPYPDGRFMVGSDDGLFDFDPQAGECRHIEGDLAEESIYYFYRDREGGIWIGTYFCGVNYISPRDRDIEWYFDNGTSAGPSGNAVSQFCEDPRGNVWIATENGGLNYFDTRRKTFRQFRAGPSDRDISYNNIHALLLDGDRLWIGTFSRGLDVMDLRTGRVRNYRHDPADKSTIPNDHIYSLYKGSDGTVYVGTLHGACSYDPAGDRFRRWERMRNVFAYDIIEDAAGDIWIASQRDGVWRYTPSTGEYVNYRHDPADPRSVASNWVIRTYIDDGGRLWFCTEGSGISRYDYQDGGFVNYGAANSLPNSVIYGMLADSEGKLWLSSNGGLIKYDPETQQATTYTFEDGMQSNQFNFRSSLRTSNGKFWFGGVNGFNCFYPSNIAVNRVKPTVAIPAVYLHSSDNRMSSQQRVTVPDGRITIPYKVVSFEILFESLSYMAPGKNRFAYMLDGVHKDWIHTAQSNVSFINLPHGHYTFRVKSTNNDGVWSDGDQKLEIHILPPPWKTAYAQALYILLALGLLATVFLFNMRRQRRLKEQEMKDMELAKEQELLQSKITFFTHVAHEIKTPVTLIKAPLDSIIENGEWNDETESNLSVIRKNTGRLMELIKQLLDFRKVDKVSYKLTFSPADVNEVLSEVVERFQPVSLSGVSIEPILPAAHLIYNIDREALTKIVSNLLTNAMKYTRSRITVSLAEKGSDGVRAMEIRVSDDGPGIAPNERQKVFEPFYQAAGGPASGNGVGIGLSLVKLLVEKHGGEVFVDPDYTAGCEICVVIPYVEPDPTVQGHLPQTDETGGYGAENDDDAAAGASLLIVEDTPDMLEFLRKNLEGQYNVCTATDGKEALECLGKRSVDLVISDIAMPVMDGFELLRAVRGDSMLCHMPFILLSAQDSIDAKIAGLDYGADAYIEKPFSLNHMKATVANLLENRRRLFEHFASVPDIQYGGVGAGQRDSEWLENVNGIINRNLTNESFNIDRLAEEMAVSRSNLQRKLKGLTGMPPNDYIRLIRLKIAAQLLKEGKYRVNEVCFIVGFNNHSYFARCFQKQFGVLPKEFAKKKK